MRIKIRLMNFADSEIIRVLRAQGNEEPEIHLMNFPTFKFS